MTARPVLVLNGPKLNLLGHRHPEIFGRETLADVEAECRRVGAHLGLSIDFRQSDAEHDLVGWINEARENTAGIVINPAGSSQNAVTITDALAACPCPVIEVRISNVHRRKAHHSHVSRVAAGVICGLGTQGYALALLHLATLFEKEAA